MINKYIIVGSINIYDQQIHYCRSYNNVFVDHIYWWILQGIMYLLIIYIDGSYNNVFVDHIYWWILQGIMYLLIIIPCRIHQYIWSTNTLYLVGSINIYDQQIHYTLQDPSIYMINKYILMDPTRYIVFVDHIYCQLSHLYTC
jgi:hypothetical protein